MSNIYFAGLLTITANL